MCQGSRPGSGKGGRGPGLLCTIRVACGAPGQHTEPTSLQHTSSLAGQSWDCCCCICMLTPSPRAWWSPTGTCRCGMIHRIYDAGCHQACIAVGQAAEPTLLEALGLSASSSGNCSRASDQERCGEYERLSADSRRSRLFCTACRRALAGQAVLTAQQGNSHGCAMGFHIPRVRRGSSNCKAVTPLEPTAHSTAAVGPGQVQAQQSSMGRAYASPQARHPHRSLLCCCWLRWMPRAAVADDERDCAMRTGLSCSRGPRLPYA